MDRPHLRLPYVMDLHTTVQALLIELRDSGRCVEEPRNAYFRHVGWGLAGSCEEDDRNEWRKR
jgi:hypothetical protein